MKRKAAKEHEGGSTEETQGRGEGITFGFHVSRATGCQWVKENSASLSCSASKAKEFELDQALQAEPVHRSENDTHHSVESDTVDATLPKRSVDPTRVAKPFNLDTVCETSVNDVLAPQPFEDFIVTAPPTSQVVSAKKKDRELRLSRSLPSSAFRYKWKRTVQQDYQEHGKYLNDKST